MGPSRLFHKNRSAHSLLNSQEGNEKARFQSSPAESPLHSPAFPPSAPYGEEEDEDEQGSRYNLPYRSGEAQFYRAGQPTRSQSQRSPSLINTNLPQPTIHLVGPAQSTPSSAIDETSPDQFYRQGPAPNPPVHKEDRKKRRFFGLGSSSKEATSSPAPAKLGRSISIRRKDQLTDQYHEPARQPIQPEYPSTHVSPTEDYGEDDEDGSSGLHPHSSAGYLPPLDKDPLRSPGLPPPISHQEYFHARTEPHSTSPTQGRRQHLDRQGSYESPWARASTNVHHRVQGDTGQQQTPSSYHPSPASATSTGSGHYYHRSQSDTLHQHWQEQQPSRPSSQQSLEPPPPTQHPRGYETHHTRAASSQASSLSQYTQGSMGPPPQPQGSNRRPSEAQPQHQGEPGREGVYQPYAQNVQGSTVLPSNAPPQYGGLAPQGQSYRTNSQTSPMQQQIGAEQGRSTPPPSRSRDDLSSMDIAQLLQRHDELREFFSLPQGVPRPMTIELDETMQRTSIGK